MVLIYINKYSLISYFQLHNDSLIMPTYVKKLLTHVMNQDKLRYDD